VRQVDWESMRPNFFFIFNHASLENQSAMWLTSFHYDGNDGLITQMNRKYPSISIFDTGSMLKQIQTILAQVSRALEAMVVLVLICGVLLLLAQIQVGMNQRRTELVVYRTLGAGKRLLRRTLWSEFALLGAMAGVVAALGAETALWLLQTRVFDFPWQPQWPLWVGLPLAGGFLLSLCGSVLG
ncbi:ABC transporter permease, partial [Klebsiella pneumoniae]|nr:ABC transporter permease [Klebsiella pneumoniae]